MKAAIGVYDTHADAIDALKQLKDSGYPEKSLSLIGKADALEDQVVFRNTNLYSRYSSPLPFRYSSEPVKALF